MKVLEKFSVLRREIGRTAELKLSGGVFRDKRIRIKDFNMVTLEAC